MNNECVCWMEKGSFYHFQVGHKMWKNKQGRLKSHDNNSRVTTAETVGHLLTLSD